MTRRLLNLLTALSLLLCGAAAALWVRSYWRYDLVESFWPTGRLTQTEGYSINRGVVVASARGRYYLQFSDNYVSVYGPRRFAHRRFTRTDELEDYPRPAFPGVGAARSGNLTRATAHHAWPVAVTLVLPAARLLGAARRRSRGRPGHCPSCGYDLTGNVSGVCPECGGQDEWATP